MNDLESGGNLDWEVQDLDCLQKPSEVTVGYSYLVQVIVNP